MSDGLFAVSGGKLAELGYGGGDDVQGKNDVRGGGVPAGAETQASPGTVGRQTQGRGQRWWRHGGRGSRKSRRTRTGLQAHGHEGGVRVRATHSKRCRRR